jgi:homoserine O-succinyltransferase
MPIVAHNDLPTFERLRAEGQNILDPARAHQQDIRELHIGLCNMMPDSALAATERQFFRLIGQSNQIAQFYVHPFSLEALPRKAEARAHIQRYYQPFERIREDGLDALIITGANVTQPDLSNEAFWEPLIEVVGLGDGARHLHPLFLPRHPCRSPVSVWPATLWTAAQAVGRLSASGRGSRPPPGGERQYPL